MATDGGRPARRAPAVPPHARRRTRGAARARNHDAPGRAAGLRWLPGFVPARDADALFARLLQGVAWRRERLHLFGRRVAVPRLLAWCGDAGVNYRYSGTDHPCHGWLPALDSLRARLADELGFSSNLVLMNRYRDGSDYLGWHRDDERGLAGTIVSVSLGATRRFLLELPGGERPMPLELEHGSVLLMDGRWRHTLPRTRRPVGERINLTFRQLAPARP